MKSVSAILLLLLAPSLLAAQTALSIQPEHCVWRAGDDLGWAAPNLDESAWQPVSTWPGFATPTPDFWVRCRFDPRQLAPAVHPELQIAGSLAWQVYADGRFIGQSGNLATGAHTAGEVVDYDAPEFTQRARPILVAVRMTFSPQLNGLQALPQGALGDAELQRSAYYSNVYHVVKEQWITWACYALITSAGLFFLALFWFDRTQRYVLWISLTWLMLADLRINEFLVAASVHYPGRLEFFLYALGQSMPVFIILFFYAVNDRPLPRAYKVILGVNAAYAVALLITAFLPLRLSMQLRWWIEVQPWSSTVQILASLGSALTPFFAFLPLRSVRKGQVPLAALCFIWMLMDTLYMLVQLPFLNLNVSAMFLRIQPYRSLAIAIVVVCLTLLLVRQLRSTNQERAALHGEMQAARQIQRLLVPGTVQEDAAGWSVDAAFLPARDVGGDFYRCRAAGGNRLRILIGDVSGKGAAAAMTAALLIGAAEERESDSPTELLQHLNVVLHNSHVGGFATCLCADLASDGSIVIANAGHLPPYRQGAELAVNPGLPLGIDPNAAYPESRFELPPGGRLTLLTDGVVEARNPSGELFGFERAAGLSTRTAAEVARAAEAFGQEDDITVLTLAFVPVEMLHA